MSKLSATELFRFCAFIGPLMIPLIAPGLAADVEEKPTPLQIRIDIDARDLPRKLLRAKLEIPVAELVPNSNGTLALWFPKWLPGTHGPGGPIQNLAGMVFENKQGKKTPLAAPAG